ncbi:DUF6338 family protein [Streptomyces sp. NPDC000345]|uniref:DUF6338 family protein n=1 Tax=Streptomyces sp. NPDC000345 TaxID=3364537 RepID=UPI0036B031B2
MSEALPASFTAVLVFFVFVVPGLAFELSLRRRVPLRAESPFVETARVLLVGALATAVAAGLLAAVHEIRPASLPSPKGLISGTARYVSAHPELSVAGLTAELVAATALALLAAGLMRPPTSGGIHGSDAWYELLYNEIPQGKHPKLVVALKSGGYRVEGFFHTMNTHPEVDRRELVLRKVEILKEEQGAPPVPWPAPFVRLAVPAREIAWVAIAHVGPPGAAPAPSPQPPAAHTASLGDRVRALQWQLAAGVLLVESLLLVALG